MYFLQLLLAINSSFTSISYCNTRHDKNEWDCYKIYIVMWMNKVLFFAGYFVVLLMYKLTCLWRGLGLLASKCEIWYSTILSFWIIFCTLVKFLFFGSSLDFWGWILSLDEFSIQNPKWYWALVLENRAIDTWLKT